MTTETLELQRASTEPLTATEMRTRVNRLQEVMKAVMIGPCKEHPEGVHYGVIPGTDKPTLYKAGAEKILMTFRIAAVVKSIEDLGVPGDEARYRVTMQGVNQVSGDVLGEGTGECSSHEEKYKWRRPVHENEYKAADPERRREKFTRKGDVWQQVRTEAADVANTILKMAVKRALVAMTLVVTAASDVFTQDIEDLPEELRDTVADKKPPVQQPQRNGEAKPAAGETKKDETAKPPASFDPELTYTLKKIYQPNKDKPYRFLELAGAGNYVATVHTWDEKVIALLSGEVGSTIRVAGKVSNFERAPFQVAKAELVSREPGAEG